MSYLRKVQCNTVNTRVGRISKAPLTKLLIIKAFNLFDSVVYVQYTTSTPTVCYITIQCLNQIQY